MRIVKNRWKYKVSVLSSAALISGFLIYSATIGDHGLSSQKEQELRIAILNAQLRDMLEERTMTEKKVQLLRPQSLDPDMLDERARDMLNMTHPNEVILQR